MYDPQSASNRKQPSVLAGKECIGGFEARKSSPVTEAARRGGAPAACTSVLQEAGCILGLPTEERSPVQKAIGSGTAGRHCTSVLDGPECIIGLEPAR